MRASKLNWAAKAVKVSSGVAGDFREIFFHIFQVAAKLSRMGETVFCAKTCLGIDAARFKVDMSLIHKILLKHIIFL